MMNLDSLALRLYLLIFPLIISGVLHMIVVRYDILSYLKTPIHLKTFGTNKTWRGMIIVPVLTAFAMQLTVWQEQWLKTEYFNQANGWFIGFMAGLGYVLAELPNSWMKRKLNIAPGQLASKHAWFFAIIDQADSALGCGLVYWCFGFLTGIELILLIVVGTLLHLLLNLLLYQFGLRKNPL
jgi:hypothetical protein